MADCGVYRIVCIPSGRVYIGSSINMRKRFQEHRSALKYGKHHSFLLQRAWNKHGSNQFRFERVLICEPGQRIGYEQALIDLHEAANPKHGMNRSAEAKGAPPSRSFLGRTHSAESRALISQRLKGREVWNKGLPSPARGIPRTDSVKASIAAARRSSAATRITIETARSMRAMHASGGVTQRAVATSFGLPYSLTSRVIRNVSWVEIANGK